MKFKNFLTLENLESFKVGDIVSIKKEFQDSDDDGKFKILELNGKKAMIQSTESKLKIVPIENVKISMLQK